MPAFGDQYSEQDIWSLVTYIRALQDPSRAPQGGGNQPRGGGQVFTFAAIDIAPPTPEQLRVADPFSDDSSAHGAATYFAQGCHLCHGAVGEAPGDLGLGQGGGQEAARAVRQGRPGMPSYSTSQISDAELGDLQGYLATIGSPQRRPDR
jgi:mono/diheme cytochrome c family protein